MMNIIMMMSRKYRCAIAAPTSTVTIGGVERDALIVATFATPDFNSASLTLVATVLNKTCLLFQTTHTTVSEQCNRFKK